MQLLTKDCDNHFCLSNTTRHEAMCVAEVSDPAAMAAAKALLRAASKTGLLYKGFFFQANCNCDDTKAFLRKLYEKKIDRLDG